MSTRYYPLYQRGNPQLRIFLPNFWMKLIKPEEPLPPNKVLFQTSIQMTKYDVKNYLEKIYKVPVVEVMTTIKMGEFRRDPIKACIRKNDDYKEALVTMPKDCKFEFPNLFEDNEAIQEKEKKKIQRLEDAKKLKIELQKKNVHSIGVPKWFSG